MYEEGTTSDTKKGLGIGQFFKRPEGGYRKKIKEKISSVVDKKIKKPWQQTKEDIKNVWNAMDEMDEPDLEKVYEEAFVNKKNEKVDEKVEPQATDSTNATEQH